jgi:superfamily I DNA and/or RNA helicase/ssDNA-binding Zn-finger/Zn-ribbon topoisomerase 1
VPEYIGCRATQGTPDIDKLISEFQQALTDDIKALKEGQGGQRILVQNGELVGHYSGRFLYRFYVDVDLTIPDDSPAQAIIETEVLTAHIVSVGPNEITLAFDKDFGASIPQAIIQTAPWFLLEQLRARLEEVRAKKLFFNFQNALKLFGFVEPTLTNVRPVQEAVTTKIDLPSKQAEALSRSLSQEVTFIWGPPGTGKTKTIAAIIDSFISANKVVLLTAHTNAAVDEALVKLAETLSNKSLLEDGKIVRYGTPSRNEAVLKQMAFDEIVARKTAPLIKAKAALEEKVKGLEKQLGQLTDLIELNEKLTRVAQEEIALQDGLARIEGLFSELKKQLQDVRESLKRLEEQLEKAKKAGFLTRVLTGLHPERIERQITEKREKERELLGRETALMAHLGELREKKASLQKKFKELSGEIEQLSRQAGLRGGSEAPAKLQELQIRLQELKREISSVQAQINNLPREIVENCRVLGATLSKLHLDPALYGRNYTVMVLDEASMAPLPAVFFAAGLITERFVVAGDFRQLPPIALAKSDVAEKWLKRDLFEQAGIVASYESGFTDERLVKLTVQHRMHPTIAEIVNAKMYGGELETGQKTVSETAEIAANEPFSGFPVVLCDTSEVNPWCTRPPGSWSRFNVYQAVLCCRIARQAVDAGIERVGIITPYTAQAKLIAKLLKDMELTENVRAATVHRFQGGEEDLVIFDAVDGPPFQRPGKPLYGPFPERGRAASEASKLINVAVTRAKGKLVLVANHSFFRQRLSKTDATFFVLDFAYHNGKSVDSRDILPSYFDELILNRRLSPQPLPEPEEWRVWNENRFYDHFLKDLRQAEERVVIFSPFLARKRLTNLVDIFRFLIDKGVGLYVVTRPAAEQKKDSELASLQKYLEEAGVKLIYRKKLHEKAAFIDDKVCWLGSLNILSHSGSSEFMLSIKTREALAQLYQFFGVEIIAGAEENQKEKRSLWEKLQKQIVALMHESRCTICGASLVLRIGKYGLFLGCERYNKTRCQGLVNVPRKIAEDAVRALKIKCPQCKEGLMCYRISSKAPFLGCDKYPECQYTIDLKS